MNIGDFPGGVVCAQVNVDYDDYPAGSKDLSNFGDEFGVIFDTCRSVLGYTRIRWCPNESLPDEMSWVRTISKLPYK